MLAVHRVAKGTRNPYVARATLDAIFNHSALLAGRENAAFAYRIDQVPEDCRGWVLVVLDVPEATAEIRRCPLGDGRVFEYVALPAPAGARVPVLVRGCLNAPGYPEYGGPVGFVDTEPEARERAGEGR